MKKTIPIKINGELTTMEVDIDELADHLLSRDCSLDEIQKILILIVKKLL